MFELKIVRMRRENPSRPRAPPSIPLLQTPLNAAGAAGSHSPGQEQAESPHPAASPAQQPHKAVGMQDKLENNKLNKLYFMWVCICTSI